MPFQQDETTLLTLDLENKDSLVLLQLPSSLSVSDLTSAYIVGHHAKQACIVVPQKGMSFTVSRVETSNALILVPPTDSTSSFAEGNERPTKKIKTNAMPTVAARTLQLHPQQQQGASFLELKSHSLKLNDLQRILCENVLDPFVSNKPWSVRRTLSSIANELQCSEAQVQRGLHRLQAFYAQGGYGLVSEEALQEVQWAIVAALTECEDLSDYANSEISQSTCVDQVLQRIPAEERYPHLTEVVIHALQLFSKESTAKEMNKGLIQLDFAKVAVCVARRIFQSRSTPWEESAFMTRWQQEVPGVEKSYHVSMDMLWSGVALLTKHHIWNYFPEDKLPTDPAKRFEALFHERVKWGLEDIRPYLTRLTDEQTEAELLLEYTRTVMEDVDGVAMNFLIRR